jgi:hypothetical protein
LGGADVVEFAGIFVLVPPPTNDAFTAVLDPSEFIDECELAVGSTALEVL